jgi:predicted RNA-binding protein with PIN domain
MPDISLEEQDDEVKLILVLRSWAVARQKREVTIIFDGGLPGGYQQRLSTSSINVIFAAEGRSADALLISRIKKVPNPPEYTLVSSDRTIQAAAAALNMTVLSSEAFIKMLREEHNPPPQVTPQKPDEAALSSAEVEEWLALFGPQPEVKPPPKAVRRKKPAARKPKSEAANQDRSPTTAKSGERKLSQDELEEWFDLFKGKKGG